MGASLADLELDDDSDFAERPSLFVVSRVQNRWTSSYRKRSSAAPKG
jgi:hypothetical protein